MFSIKFQLSEKDQHHNPPTIHSSKPNCFTVEDKKEEGMFD
jgi:hypothetical protein